MLKLEKKQIPEDIDYNKIKNIASEARQKLEEVRPKTIAQAIRISGVNPSDISIFLENESKSPFLFRACTISLENLYKIGPLFVQLVSLSQSPNNITLLTYLTDSSPLIPTPTSDACIMLTSLAPSPIASVTAFFSFFISFTMADF